MIEFSSARYVFSLSAYAATRACKKKTEGRAVAMHSEHTRPLSCLHSLFPACHWHRHVRAVERKLFFQLAETPTQTRYTTHTRVYIYDKNNLFIGTKLGIFLPLIKVNEFTSLAEF